jgi:hypothetical protein
MVHQTFLQRKTVPYFLSQDPALRATELQRKIQSNPSEIQALNMFLTFLLKYITLERFHMPDCFPFNSIILKISMMKRNIFKKKSLHIVFRFIFVWKGRRMEKIEERRVRKRRK